MSSVNMSSSTSSIPISQILSIIPRKPADIPSEEKLIKEAQALLEASQLWTPGKVFEDVKTFHQPRDQISETHTSWFCAVSEYRKEDISFSRMWDKIGLNKATSQQRYTPEIAKLTRIEYISESKSIWTMLYSSPPPLSQRVFTVMQITHLIDYPANERTGIILTIPIDLSSSTKAALEENGVKARYVSVEHIKELVGGSVIEWRKVAATDPGGYIPKFLVDREMPEGLAQEIHHCMSWIRNTALKKKKQESSE